MSLIIIASVSSVMFIHGLIYDMTESLLILSFMLLMWGLL